ncbi:MAG: ATP-binding cassette domain-containing protein [Hyphomicrobiaceae bacterium]
MLNGITADFSPGTAVALIGANGAGKSTLIKCLVRLIEPDAGQICVLGHDVSMMTGAALRQIRSRVGIVWQKHNLVPRVSALTNVLHGMQSRLSGPGTWWQAIASARARAEALTCLEAVGLSGVATQRADQLSGGQSQRVALARVLMQKPSIILADEPDASLDPQAGDDVMRLLASLARSQKLTLIFVSHRLQHALEHADRIIGLSKGRILLDVPAAQAEASDLRRFFGERRP